MDINVILGVVGLVLSVVSLIYAVYITEKNKRDKNLIYETMPPAPVAEVIKGQREYSLRVVYERPDEKPVYIQHAVMKYVRFTNFGRIPIKRSDLTSVDPLRIELSGGNILDIALAGVTRDVCQIKILPFTTDEKLVSAEIDFEFLDYLDGGIIQILSDSDTMRVVMKGTIIEMPAGIKDLREVSSKSDWGCSIMVILVIAINVSTPFIYRYVTGTWNYVWLLGLPIVAFIVPLFIMIPIYSAFGSQRKSIFPESLLPPRWYQMHRPMTNSTKRRNSEIHKQADKLKDKY